MSMPSLSAFRCFTTRTLTVEQDKAVLVPVENVLEMHDRTICTFDLFMCLYQYEYSNYRDYLPTMNRIVSTSLLFNANACLMGATLSSRFVSTRIFFR